MGDNRKSVNTTALGMAGIIAALLAIAYQLNKNSQE
jgi:hypothetical protein